MMDYLAEVTMSIMQKQKSRDPSAGYARDFVPLMERILPDVVAKGIRVTTNAGGVNPRGCAEAVVAVGAEAGARRASSGSGWSSGDDILGRLDELHRRGATRCATWRPAARSPTSATRCSPPTPTSGMAPIVEALRAGPTSWSPAG